MPASSTGFDPLLIRRRRIACTGKVEKERKRRGYRLYAPTTHPFYTFFRIRLTSKERSCRLRNGRMHLLRRHLSDGKASRERLTARINGPVRVAYDDTFCNRCFVMPAFISVKHVPHTNLLHTVTKKLKLFRVKRPCSFM